MKPDRLVFAAVLLMCAAAALTTLLPDAGGGQHPDYATMRHGDPDVARHGAVLWLGWLFGVAMLLLFAALIAFGARRHLRRAGRWLALATAAVIGCWSWIVHAYRGYLDDPAPALYLALPAPTAIMVYLFVPLTLVFVLLFILGFRHWVLTDDDLETFERLAGADGEATRQAPPE